MSYIPGLTLPASVFNSAPASILLPLTLGLGSGLLSQPGRSVPKSGSDTAATDRGTWKPRQERYSALKLPAFRPPPWLFAPVWATLYVLMGYASHRAWTNGMASKIPRNVEDTRRAATLYTIQLGLNLAFMPLFFGLGRPIDALIDIVTLTGALGYLAYLWSRVDKVAAYCLAPYLAWLGFANYLTAATGYLNGWTAKEPGQKEE
ncbi:hypothetical protein DV736_g4638, partial [Chaetothyriales sp. CBS 134916]